MASRKSLALFLSTFSLCFFVNCSKISSSHLESSGGLSSASDRVAIPYRIGYTASDNTAEQDLASVNAWLGRPLDMSAATIVMSGWWWGGIPKSYAVDVSFPMLSISGWDSVGATDLGQAASGAYDSHYIAMSQTLAQAGNKMFVRIGWEMNGNWYPWSIGGPAGTNNTAANYIATFRRIVGILRTTVPGVQIEFCTNWEDGPYTYSDGSNAGTPLDYWPGSQYVDVVSMDIYQTNIGNWQKTQSGGAFDLDWLVTFAQSQNVKVGLSEWGAGGGDAAYITSAIHWMNSLGNLFIFSVYSSWAPADQFILAGANSEEQDVWVNAWSKTYYDMK